MVWNMKFLSVTVRNVLFSAKRNEETLNREIVSESIRVQKSGEESFDYRRSGNQIHPHYIITPISCIRSYL